MNQPFSRYVFPQTSSFFSSFLFSLSLLFDDPPLLRKDQPSKDVPMKRLSCLKSKAPFLIFSKTITIPLSFSFFPFLQKIPPAPLSLYSGIQTVRGRNEEAKTI